MPWYKDPHTASLILRYGLGFVFLWFGFSQLSNPAPWTGFLPAWVATIGISSTKFVLLNGLFEIVGAFLILTGAFTRLAALLLGVHLLGIALSVGMSAVGVRDIGLSMATLALAALGTSRWSLDALPREGSL